MLLCCIICCLCCLFLPLPLPPLPLLRFVVFNVLPSPHLEKHNITTSVCASAEIAKKWKQNGTAWREWDRRAGRKRDSRHETNKHTKKKRTRPENEELVSSEKTTNNIHRTAATTELWCGYDNVYKLRWHRDQNVDDMIIHMRPTSALATHLAVVAAKQNKLFEQKKDVFRKNFRAVLPATIPTHSRS